MSTSTSTPAISALVPWFGSKRTLAPRIVAELGKHKAYWEPFCGSMAVLLLKPRCSMETVGDLHGDLINVARVIQDPIDGPVFYRRLRRLLMHGSLFDECAATCDGPPEWGVERAIAFFVWSWQGRNGIAGTKKCGKAYSVRYTRNGGHAATRWTSAVHSIRSWRDRLSGVTILHRCGFDQLARIEDDDEVAIYVDPPYLTKGAEYVHDFVAADHQRLAELVWRFQRTRVVVSYYDDPRLDALYPGWTKVHCPTTKALVQQGRRDKTGSVIAPEVLLINGPSYTSGDSQGRLL